MSDANLNVTRLEILKQGTIKEFEKLSNKGRKKTQQS